MRIRKRWPLLPPSPASASSPSPPTPDLTPSRLHPLLSSRGPSSPSRGLYRRPSNSQNQSLQEGNQPRPDLQLVILKRTNGQIFSNGDIEEEKEENKGDDSMQHRHTQIEDPQVELAGEEVGAKDKRLVTSSHSQRNGNSSGAKACVGILVSSSSSSHQGGRSWDGERMSPLKKRKESLVEEMIMEKDKKMKKTILRTKRNNKWVHQQETKEEDIVKKKRKKGNVGGGGAMMEGSRCSRVNGRGWRCCHQTLVGYSLCEHHLGKGRLRSMSSVRSRSFSMCSNIKKDKDDELLSLPLENEDDEEEEEEEEEEEKPLMIRKKIGMVKARSISSLLGLTQHAPLATLPSPRCHNNGNNLNLMI